MTVTMRTTNTSAMPDPSPIDVPSTFCLTVTGSSPPSVELSVVGAVVVVLVAPVLVMVLALVVAGECTMVVGVVTSGDSG